MFRANLDPETRGSERVEREPPLSACTADGDTTQTGSGRYAAQVAALRSGVIGEDAVFRTDLGYPRKITYTDYTASGRALRPIEEFIEGNVLPLYGNTHTISSATARQTTYFRSEARQVVKNFYNCSHEDALIFTGNGATGAAGLFIDLLRKTRGFTAPPKIREEDRWGSVRCTVCDVTFKTDKGFRSHSATESHRAAAEARRHLDAEIGSAYTGCDILVDPMAHHSSLLPFRALRDGRPTFYELHVVDLDPESGCLSLPSLEEHLRSASHRKRRIVAVLSGGSNVTGIQPNHAAVDGLCAAHNAILCWDLAAVAGHRRFDFTPGCGFAFISPHKLLGGPGTCGVLLAKKRYLCNELPCRVGGGVVHYVTPQGQQYIDNLEEREEAGTPNIMACIRAGLVYRTHSLLSPSLVVSGELSLYWRIFSALSSHPNVHILAEPSLRGLEDDMQNQATPLPILSFCVVYSRQGGGALYLHHNFVTVLLNDLFGVQVRGGCACAGPYAQELLGMTPEVTEWYNHILSESGLEVLRPGFVRTGTHFTMTEEDAEVIIQAVRYIADSGWKFLAAYRFDEETGEWSFRKSGEAGIQKSRRWLSELDPFSSGVRLGCGGVSPEEVQAARSQGIRGMVREADRFLDTVYSGAADRGVPLSSVHDPACLIPEEYSRAVFFARPRDFIYSIASQCPDGEKAALQNLSELDIKPLVEDARISPFQVRGAESGSSGDMPGQQKAVASPPPSTEGPPTDDPLGAEMSQVIEGGGGDDDDDDGDAQIQEKKAKKKKGGGIPRQIRSKVGEAMSRWGMVGEGDRVLVGLSGGKDSLSLLHILMAVQRVSPVKFAIGAATVNPMTPEYDPTPLVPYMAQIGVPYKILSKPLITLAREKLADERRPSICSFCARMKRGMLYEHMKAEGYTVLALGQHLDDIVESFLMSLFRNGSLATMKAGYRITEGVAEDELGEEAAVGQANNGLRIIRPLALVRERGLAAFAKEAGLPVVPDNCPACFSAPKERARVKVMLSQLEAENAQLFPSILRAIEPLMSVDHTDRTATRLARRAAADGIAAHTEHLDLQAEVALMPCGAAASCAE